MIKLEHHHFSISIELMGQAMIINNFLQQKDHQWLDHYAPTYGDKQEHYGVVFIRQKKLNLNLKKTLDITIISNLQKI